MLQKMRSELVVSDGGAPTEKEEVAGGPLSCLFGKLWANMAPCVDMGVWGPFGDDWLEQ